MSGRWVPMTRAALLVTLMLASWVSGRTDRAWAATPSDRNPFLSIEEQTVRPVETRPPPQRTVERITRPPLTAIVYHPGDAVAIIDGRIVRVGDRVESKQVMEITPEQVWLQDQRARYLLELSDVVGFARPRGGDGTTAVEHRAP